MILFALYYSVYAQNINQQFIELDLQSVVKYTLELNPNIQRQILSVERSKAELQNVRGTFDLQLNSELNIFRNGNDLLPLDPRNQFFSEINNREGQFRIGLQKTFRNSMTIQTGVDWNRKSNNIPFDEFQQMESPYLDRNTGNISLSFLQPLLRGSGRKVITANERANIKLVEAQEENLVQVTAQELLGVIQIYWQYLGSYKIWKVNEQNEARVKQLLEMTKTLIEADKKPRAELIQIQADLAQKQGQTILAEQNFLQLKQALKRSIGFDEKIDIGLPDDEFPSPDMASYRSDLSGFDFYEIGIENRRDLKALNKSLDAIYDYLLLSENATKPELNLSGIIGYGGIRKGDELNNLLKSLGEKEGRNWNAGVSLSYLFPLQNNKAKAQLTLQEIRLQDQDIILENEVRNLKINLDIAVNNLKQSYAALIKSEETYNLFLTTFANEQEKFQNGLTTLINVILFQERLTLAETQYIQFMQQFAINLALLRFETGTLINESFFENGDLTTLDFYSIPN